MRVEWVHPSWRDLVIESLAQDAEARRHFLARCGVDGAALALSGAGGASGDRERPLLREDADWDALGDGLYGLCSDLGEAEAAQLLGVLEAAGEHAEVLALARLALDRLGWAGKAVSVDAIAAWAPLAARLDPRPEPPALALTWLELEPHALPETPEELERFADWVRLAEVLWRYDAELLARLGFPDRYADLLGHFAEDGPREEPVLEREMRIEALGRLRVLDPELAGAAKATWLELIMDAATPPAATPPPARGFPVDRVLRDLVQ
jgi:hypothetical protein